MVNHFAVTTETGSYAQIQEHTLCRCCRFACLCVCFVGCVCVLLLLLLLLLFVCLLLSHRPCRTRGVAHTARLKIFTPNNTTWSNREAEKNTDKIFTTGAPG